MIVLCGGSEDPPTYVFRNHRLGVCRCCSRPFSVRIDGKIRRHGVKI